MTSAQQRTAAVAPEAGYSRPRLVEPDGLSVSVRTEDGDTRVFDFRSVDAPPELSETARGRVREGVRAHRHLATDWRQSIPAGRHCGGSWCSSAKSTRMSPRSRT